MKVLERKQPRVEDFKLEHTCKVCESRLLIEAGDLRQINGRYGSTYEVMCVVCGAYFSLPKEEVPLSVREFARHNTIAKDAYSYYDK